MFCSMARDLKLENFLFSDETADSELKMIDFGLSKVSALLLRGLVSCARIYFDMTSTLCTHYLHTRIDSILHLEKYSMKQ
jgi:serine/threonine protein kinase